MNNRIGTLLMVTLFFVSLSIAAYAETIVYVNFASGQDTPGNGTEVNPYKTITYALNNGVPATLNDAYTILVTDSVPATSYENITIVNKVTTAVNTLTIKAKYPRVPIIKGRKIDDFSVTIRVDNNYVTIDGFTLRNEGCVNGIFHFKGYSGGIYDGNPANPTTETTQVASVINCDFDGENISGVGNLCVVFPCNPHINVTIANNRFYNCPVDWYLCYVKNTCPGARVTFTQNEIYNSTNAVFAAIKKVGGTGPCDSLVFERNRVYGNHLSSNTIGMLYIMSKAIIRNNLLYNNTGYTNLIEIIDDTDNTVDGTTIYNNTLYNNDGNLIYIDGAATGCSVKNNILWAKPNGKYCIYLKNGAQTGFTSATNLFYADFNNNGIYDSATDYVVVRVGIIVLVLKLISFPYPIPALSVAFKFLSQKGKTIIGTKYLLSDWQSTYEVNPPGYSLFQMPNFASTIPDDIVFLHITDSPPCRDGGVDIAEVTNDFDGSLRSIGHYDIGADKFVADTLPPSIPTGLTATAVSASRINLSWDPSTDNVGVAGYNVYRNGISVVRTNSTFYQDAGLSPLTTYIYNVDAFDALANISQQSVSVSATTFESQFKMHVSNIAMSLNTRTVGKNKYTKAIATVTIVDASNNPVKGATVYGSWSGATTGTVSGITDSTGKVALSSNEVKNAPTGTEFTFTVTNIVLDGWAYDANANVETSDSIITS